MCFILFFTKFRTLMSFNSLVYFEIVVSFSPCFLELNWSFVNSVTVLIQEWIVINI